jgi:hypothetical protein
VNTVEVHENGTSRPVETLLRKGEGRRKEKDGGGKFN